MERTKKQKIKANLRRVNTQLTFDSSKYKSNNNAYKNPESKERSNELGSIKRDIVKSLIIASLILISLGVIYWFS